MRMWTAARWWSAGRTSIDYDAALPILAIQGDRVVGSVTLYRNRTGWKQRVGIVRILIAPDHRHLGLGTAMIREIRHLGEKVALNYLLAEVIEEQQAAVRALERMGFEKAGSIGISSTTGRDISTISWCFFTPCRVSRNRCLWY